MPSELISIVLSFCLPKDIGKLSLTSKIFQDLSDEVARDMLLALFEKNDKITHRDKLHMRKCLSRDDLKEMSLSDSNNNSATPIWTLLRCMYAQSVLDENALCKASDRVDDTSTGKFHYDKRESMFVVCIYIHYLAYLLLMIMSRYFHTIISRHIDEIRVASQFTLLESYKYRENTIVGRWGYFSAGRCGI